MAGTLDDRARELRRNPTEPEIRLWRRLSNAQLGGFKFRRQHKIGPRILDFFCPAIGLGVEVDGDTHDTDKDAVRDKHLKAQGFHILRFTNADVMHNIEGVLEALLSRALSLPPRWNNAARPHPNPSPEGEGL